MHAHWLIVTLAIYIFSRDLSTWPTLGMSYNLYGVVDLVRSSYTTQRCFSSPPCGDRYRLDIFSIMTKRVNDG